MRKMSEEKLNKLMIFINQYIRENNGVSPTLNEIMKQLNMVRSTAYRYILELNKRGMISYTGKNTLFTSFQNKVRVVFRSIPVAGMIVCGTPDDQEECIEEYLAIPEEWIDGDCFLLEAYGDSMTDVGIDEGDLVLIKKTEVANNGDVVVALTEEGSTIKRIFFDNGITRLYAENSTYSAKQRNIYPKKISIQGIALKAIKDIK